MPEYRSEIRISELIAAASFPSISLRHLAVAPAGVTMRKELC